MPRFLSGIPSRPAITNGPGRRARGEREGSASAARAHVRPLVKPSAALVGSSASICPSLTVMSVAKLTLPDDAEGAHALDYSYSSATSGEQMLESKRIFAYNPSIFARVKD